MDYLSKLRAKLIEERHGEKYQQICLDYAEKLIKNNLPVIFDKKHLCLLMGIKESKLNYYLMHTERFYNRGSLPKSNGEFREILMPSFHLKEIQRWILDNILYDFRVHEAAYGFVVSRNIKHNAMVHVGQVSIVNLDLKNFFPTIHFGQVFRLFFSSGYTKEMSYIMAKLCTFKDKLPQGAPTSPCIANILCNSLDKRLTALTSTLNYKYSRYADDITISGEKDVKGLIPEIIKIIESEGFSLNLSKLRVQENSLYKEITGLIVSDSVRVKSKYKRQLDKHIYYCLKFGVNNHLKKIDAENKSNFKEYLYGMANFIKMIEPDTGKIFIERLDKIIWGRGLSKKC